jgi:hypothetical protein
MSRARIHNVEFRDDFVWNDSKEKDSEDLEEKVSKEKDLFMRMTVKDPAKRISLSKVLILI